MNFFQCVIEFVTGVSKESPEVRDVTKRIKAETEANNSDQGILDCSSVGLGFLNPTSQLRLTNVIAFCMQIRNSEDR